jgi:hypothetical protein
MRAEIPWRSEMVEKRVGEGFVWEEENTRCL